MAAFSYQALDADGKVNRGIIEGESERQVRALLRSRQLKPISVEAANTPVVSRWRFAFTRGLPPEQRVLLTRQLATLVKAGVPLDEALAATARQSRHAATKTLLLQLRGKVVAGQSLSAAVSVFPGTFPPLYVALTRAGEQAGLLGDVLSRLADHLELRHQLQQRLQLAMIYPATLIGVAMLVVAVLMVKVLPSLDDLFLRNGHALPLLTRILMGLSRGLAHWWPLVLGLLAALGVVVRHLLQQPHWQARWHRTSLHLPLLGTLLRAADSARFASTLGLLAQSGVTLVEALAIAAGVIDNSVLRQAALAAARTVEEGGSLARALDAEGCFPPLLTQLVASGESSGTLDVMLGRAAAMQEQELAQTLDGLLKVLEPLLLVVMALVVGSIVLAVLLPIMQMNTLVG